jgi:hypothetical protein
LIGAVVAVLWNPNDFVVDVRHHQSFLKGGQQRNAKCGQHTGIEARSFCDLALHKWLVDQNVLVVAFGCRGPQPPLLTMKKMRKKSTPFGMPVSEEVFKFTITQNHDKVLCCNFVGNPAAPDGSIFFFNRGQGSVHVILTEQSRE